MRFILSICLGLAFIASANATPFYRHVPFTLTIQPGDKVIADYEMKDDTGVRCYSKREPFEINFVYKGRQKSAVLPIVLQNSHVPESPREELADLKGKLAVAFAHPNKAHVDSLKCDYTEPLN